MNINESGEMYLETIYLLSLKNEHVRSLDIAKGMGFSKPSVSRAVHILEDNDYITIDTNGYIHLTDKGYNHAKNIYERHTVLTKMLTSLGVEEKTAEEDACKIEHVISGETFSAIKKHINMD